MISPKDRFELLPTDYLFFPGNEKDDTSTLFGRFWLAWHVYADPFTLLHSNSNIRAAQTLLQEHAIPHNAAIHDGLDRSNTEIFVAQKLVASAVHPDTNEIIPRASRRCSYLPFNVPLYMGMLFSPQTIPWLIMWQTTNQAYNCCNIYFNRNASNDDPVSISELGAQFCAATGAASALAVASKLGINRLQAQFGFCGNVFWRGFFHGAVPFAASAAATVCNLAITRRQEMRHGVRVQESPDGQELIASTTAGVSGVGFTGYSRLLLLVPGLLVAPTALAWAQGHMERLRWSPWLRGPLRGALLTMSMVLSVPLSMAPVPQWCTIEAQTVLDEVEGSMWENTEAAARLQNLVETKGGSTLLYYNRGV